GGPLLASSGHPYAQAFLDAMHSPRMYGLEQALLEGARRIGVDLFEQYVYTDCSPFGDASVLQWQDQPIADAYKYRALLDYMATAPAVGPNQAPVNTVPGEQNVLKNTGVRFSAQN